MFLVHDHATLSVFSDLSWYKYRHVNYNSQIIMQIFTLAMLML